MALDLSGEDGLSCVGVLMRRSELLQGIRAMRFGYVYERFEGGELSQAEPG